MNLQFKVLSYNIHKGFATANLKYTLDRIKESIQVTQADLVCLQEVIGQHEVHSKKIKNWPTESQFEFLADQVWSHYAYGKNAVYSEGHHGNAILSQHPIVKWANQDISITPFESRGLLHAQLQLPNSNQIIHVLNVHLSLIEKDRRQQLNEIIKKVNSDISIDEPLIIAGDFNDWRCRASLILKKDLNVDEVSLIHHNKHAVTFPAFFPLLSLDRIYFRNLKCISSEALRDGVWSKISDHLPLSATFEII